MSITTEQFKKLYFLHLRILTKITKTMTDEEIGMVLTEVASEEIRETDISKEIATENNRVQSIYNNLIHEMKTRNKN